MEEELLGRIEDVLKEAGFRRVHRQTASGSATVSAEKEGRRAVFHIAEPTAAPIRAATNVDIPDVREVRTKAALPGIGQPVAGQGGGAGTPARRGPRR